MQKYLNFLSLPYKPVALREKGRMLRRTLKSWFRKSQKLRASDMRQICRSVLDQASPVPTLKNPELALAGLLATFREMQIRGEVLGNAWWADFLRAVALNNEEGTEVQQRLQQGLANHPPSILQYWQWMHLTKIAMKFGLFHLAYLLRSKARDAAILALKNQTCSPMNSSFRVLLAAAAEAGEWDLFKANLNRLKFGSKYKKNALVFLEHLASNQPIDARENSRHSENQAESEFEGFVKNKTIAFVGPSKTSAKDAAEIDGYDLVVRCNYKEAGLGVDPEIKGLRCDISYFNNTQTIALCERETVQIPEVIKFAVFRNQPNWKVFRKKFQQSPSRSGGELITRVSPNYSPMLFEGILNAIPNALCDLLRFDVKIIKIFHADLMLTVDRIAGYHPGVDNSAKHVELFIKSCVGVHDPVTQYAFYKLMHRAKKISGDRRFESVMDLGEESYMKELQQIYGNFARVAPFSISR